MHLLLVVTYKYSPPLPFFFLLPSSVPFASLLPILQKSVVLMSPHPYVGLYKKVISVVGPIFFECGQTLLEAAYQNIAFWPNPSPGHTFELPILGSTLTYHVPFSASTPRILSFLLSLSHPPSLSLYLFDTNRYYRSQHARTSLHAAGPGSEQPPECQHL